MTIRKAAPDAEETISYQMPTFTLKGNLVYCGAFKTEALSRISPVLLAGMSPVERP